MRFSVVEFRKEIPEAKGATCMLPSIPPPYTLNPKPGLGDYEFLEVSLGLHAVRVGQDDTKTKLPRHVLILYARKSDDHKF